MIGGIFRRNVVAGNYLDSLIIKAPDDFISQLIFVHSAVLSESS